MVVLKIIDLHYLIVKKYSLAWLEYSGNREGGAPECGNTMVWFCTWMGLSRDQRIWWRDTQKTKQKSTMKKIWSNSLQNLQVIRNLVGFLWVLQEFVHLCDQIFWNLTRFWWVRPVFFWFSRCPDSVFGMIFRSLTSFGIWSVSTTASNF